MKWRTKTLYFHFKFESNVCIKGIDFLFNKRKQSKCEIRMSERKELN
jgi:hypothetical protein